ncbi:MAG: sulfatase-like hydrolase/transferase [Phycisphaerales bacterium]|nr:sulfatase-like hydrolase/transferase [Phycisphaerales bacterium]
MSTASKVVRRVAPALSALVCASACLAQSRPNLIFVLTDDQGIDAIQGPHWPGSANISTPTIRRLAEQGVSFTNCRMNPNCSPTRAAMMTGRSALQCGVPGVIGRWPSGQTPPPLPIDANPDGNEMPIDVHLLSMATEERTIAEVLRDSGYYTVLIDKWHVGYNAERGQLPTQQGFDVFFDWAEFLLQDDPDQVGDEHMVRMAEFARQSIQNRSPEHNGKPYALFYHSITPHRRDPDSGGKAWWAVDPTLTPNTAGLGDSNSARFAQNIEAFDTTLRRLLSQLEVIDSNDLYNPDARAVVFYAGDNGTDGQVSAFGPRAKNTLYEGGIRVPCFVFGENVPRNLNNPIADDRQIAPVDWYDTICDVIDAPPNVRDNPLGNFPRQSMSFADSIGWENPGSRPRREYSLLSLGTTELVNGQHQQIWRVALVSDRYKLICNSGGAFADDMSEDEFYDLSADPNEFNNLLVGGLTHEQANAYYAMRDAIVDHWPSSVSVPFDPANLSRYSIEHFDPTRRFVLVAYIENGELTGEHEFYDLAVDPDQINDLVGQSMTPEQASAYNTLQGEALVLFNEGEFSPDVRVVDLPLSATLVMTGGNSTVSGPLTLGHSGVGSNPKEYRAFLKFSVTGALPDGFTIDDVTAAQLVVGFKEDSRASSDPLYPTVDRNTGVIRVHQVTRPWTSNPWANWNATVLGSLDLPPHIIWQPSHPKIRAVPLPPQTPISFGHNEALLNVVRGWFQQPRNNNGLVLVVDLLPGLNGDQHVHFLRAAGLRLTLDRRPE